MRRLDRFLFRLRRFANRRDIERSMDAEMRYHVECETSDAMRAGVPAADARRHALRSFGGVERYKEEARDDRGFRYLEELMQDARLALRVLRRNPAYTTAAILTFALGIGLTTAIFSVVHGVLLRPLPYANPDRLAVLWERHPARHYEQNVVSVPNFEAWHARSRSFSAMAALVPAPTTLNGTTPERVMGAQVSAGYFHLLGVLPVLGRDFNSADEVNGGASVAILSDGLWRRRYGADSAIIGRVVSFDEKPVTIVGVMPAGFDAPSFGWLPAHELWVPFGATASNRQWGRFLLVLGRLRDGVSISTARAELAAIAAQREHEEASNAGWSATVLSLNEQITGDVRRPLLVLLGAVGLLLLMAATNVGSLTLGFMRRRVTELAVRRAIGASAGRLFRQLLTHSLVLGGIGTAIGVAAAVAGTRALLAIVPPDVPRASGIRVDSDVLLFTSLVSLAATLGFGVSAALRSSSRPSADRASGARASARIGGGSLVIAEIALGLILTVLAGLMVRSFDNLRRVNVGFDATNVITARISLPSSSYDTPERQSAFFETLGQRMRAMPGVQAVSFATTRPFSCCAPVTTVRNPADNSTATSASPTVDIRYVDSSYFVALRIPTVAGRGFLANERAGGPPQVVINQQLAGALWHDIAPLSRTLDITLNNGLHATVVGVVGDVRLAGVRTPARGTVYLWTAQNASSVRDIIVRGDGKPDVIVRMMHNALTSVDPRLPLSLVTALTSEVDRSVASDRFTTMILSLFAVVSLLLAGVGIYGVFAGDVSARRKEIGIRLALGANGSGLMLLVVRRAVELAIVGAAIGVAGGLVAAQSIQSIVFDVDTADPREYAAVAGLLLAVAIVATLVPAIRAARVSPLDVIRSD